MTSQSPTPETLAIQRRQMIEQQLRARGISSPAVLRAMNEVPRECFVSAKHQSKAYEDRPLPIGFGQTISQPYTVAFMAEALELSPTDRVLEIGAGCGYAAAVLSRMAAEVISVERIEPLAEQARRNLQEIGITNVSIYVGDGSLGWPDEAPYNAIVCAAGGVSLPDSYYDQLAEGGRIVIPFGEQPREQRMYKFRKTKTDFYQESLGRFAFVPLIGEQGWPEE